MSRQPADQRRVFHSVSTATMKQISNPRDLFQSKSSFGTDLINMPPPLADDESTISSYTHRTGSKSSARQNAPVDTDIDTSLQIGVSKFGNFRSRPVAATPRVQETVQEPKTPQSTASIFMTSLELADSAPLPPPAAGITLQRKTTILNPSRQLPFGRKNSVSEPNRLRETFRSRGRLSSTVSQAVWPAITAPSMEPVLQEQAIHDACAAVATDITTASTDDEDPMEIARRVAAAQAAVREDFARLRAEEEANNTSRRRPSRMRSSASGHSIGISSDATSLRSSRVGTPDLVDAPQDDDKPLKKRFDEDMIALDVMQSLKHDSMEAFKDAFLAYDEPLAMDQFVECIMPYLPAHLHATQELELKLVTSLCEFFSAVDINGDGTMEWEEFTGYIIDAGMSVNDASSVDAIEEYVQSPVTDVSRHDRRIEKIEYFQQIDQLIAWESGDAHFRVYNGKTGALQHVVPGHYKELLSSDIVLDRYIVTSGNDRFLRFWDPLQEYRAVSAFMCTEAQLVVRSMPMESTNKQILVSAGDDYTMNAWSIEASVLERNERPSRTTKFTGHKDVVLDLLFLPNLNALCSASLDGTVGMWDLTTARRKHSLTGHARGVYSLTYNSEFHCLISGGFDHDALIFNPYYAQCIGRLKGHRDSLVRVQTVPGTPQIVTADVSGFVKIWDVRTFGCVQTLALEDERDSEARSAELTSFRVCPPHKRLALGGESRIVYFDAISEVVIDPELADQKPVTVCLYNTEQGTFLTAAGQTAKVWSGKTGALQAVYRNICDADITAMCFDESLKKFIVGDAEGNVKVLNFSNGSEMCHFQPPHDGDVSAVYYMIGKASLLTASWDGSIREWDESDHEESDLMRHHHNLNRGEITGKAVSASLRLCAVSTSSGAVLLWDYEKHMIDGELFGHSTEITSLMWLEPYPLLVTTDAAGNLCVWAVRPVVIAAGVCILRLQNDPPPAACAGGEMLRSPSNALLVASEQQQVRLARRRAAAAHAQAIIDAAGVLPAEFTVDPEVQAAFHAANKEAAESAAAYNAIASPKKAPQSPVKSSQRLPPPTEIGSSIRTSLNMPAAVPTDTPAVALSPFTSVAWHEKSGTLFAADTEGLVRSFDLHTVIRRWRILPFEYESDDEDDEDGDDGDSIDSHGDIVIPKVQSINEPMATLTIKDIKAAAPSKPEHDSESSSSETDSDSESSQSDVGSEGDDTVMIPEVVERPTRAQAFDAYRLAHIQSVEKSMGVVSSGAMGVGGTGAINADFYRMSVRAGDVVLNRIWAAHRDAIKHLHVVGHEPPNLVTSSFDCKVRIWDPSTGACVGALHQGVSAAQSLAQLQRNPRHSHRHFISWAFDSQADPLEKSKQHAMHLLDSRGRTLFPSASGDSSIFTLGAK